MLNFGLSLKKIIFLTVLILLTFMLYHIWCTNDMPNERLTEFIDQLAQREAVNGVVLVARENCIIYEKAFGYANFETKTKNNIDTQFSIASITKMFTAAAILKLADEKKINLQKTVNNYIPKELWGSNIPGWTEKITIHNLLTHTGGLQSYLRIDGIDNILEKIVTSQELLQFLAKAESQETPGSKFRYSGTEYNLLGIVIESISGKPYGQFLSDAFFKPLGMDRTFATNTVFINELFEKDKTLAHGYEQDAEKKDIKPGWDINMSTMYTESGIISTAPDLLKWSNALFDNKILTEKSLSLMLKPYIKAEDDYYAGYGMYKTSINNTDIYMHDGFVSGYKNVFLYIPQKMISIIVLENITQDQYSAAHIGTSIAEELLHL